MNVWKLDSSGGTNPAYQGSIGLTKLTSAVISSISGKISEILESTKGSLNDGSFFITK